MLPFPSPAPVLRALLRALLSDEYALYLATRDATRSAPECDRPVLETQARRLDSHLTWLAWQLGCWGDHALVGASAPVERSNDRPSPVFAGGCIRHHLRLLHASLLGQIHRFIARTSRSGDRALEQLLADLLAGHASAIAALRKDDSVASAIGSTVRCQAPA